MQRQVNPETYGRQSAYHGICVHAFVAMKPERLNSYRRYDKYCTFFLSFAVLYVMIGLNFYNFYITYLNLRLVEVIASFRIIRSFVVYESKTHDEAQLGNCKILSGKNNKKIRTEWFS